LWHTGAKAGTPLDRTIFRYLKNPAAAGFFCARSCAGLALKTIVQQPETAPPKVSSCAYLVPLQQGSIRLPLTRASQSQLGAGYNKLSCHSLTERRSPDAREAIPDAA